MARERAKWMDQAPFWAVNAVGAPGKLCRPPMASPEPGRMIAFASFQWLIWGMSVHKKLAGGNPPDAPNPPRWGRGGERAPLQPPTTRTPTLREARQVAAAVGCLDQPYGADARLDALAGAFRCEDRVATGQRDAVEGDLLGSRPGTRRGARALPLRALRHRVEAERQGTGEAHWQAAAHCAGPLWAQAV
jgi:hypothetical protein